MEPAEESRAESGDLKRAKRDGQASSDYLAEMLVALRTAANGFVRQCTSANIAHQLGLTPFDIEAMEAKNVAEQLNKEASTSCVVLCYDSQIPVLDRVMRVYATVKMMNREMSRRKAASSATTADTESAGAEHPENQSVNLQSRLPSAVTPESRQGTEVGQPEVLQPRWLIIDDMNFQVVCSVDGKDLAALRQTNVSTTLAMHKNKLAISLELPYPSPIQFEIVPFQQVVYSLDLEPASDAAWLRVAELLGVGRMPWVTEAESRYLSGKGDSSPYTDTEIEVAEV